jgi:hypothetical protein
MEQRPLRLGDLVDDYCPRERRVTDHAIVAIVNDSIRQTRCTACEAEHVFKGGKAPRRRTKASTDQPTDNAGGQLVAPAAQTVEPVGSTNGHYGDESPAEESRAASSEPAAAIEIEEPAEPAVEPEPESRPDDGPVWFGHRPQIRATLPRTENDVPPPRPIPEFTIYQRHNVRGNGFRGRGGWSGASGNGNGNGNVARGDRRPGFGGQGQGQGQGQGPGQGQGQGRRRHGKRRPR